MSRQPLSPEAQAELAALRDLVRTNTAGLEPDVHGIVDSKIGSSVSVEHDTSKGTYIVHVSDEDPYGRDEEKVGITTMALDFDDRLQVRRAAVEVGGAEGGIYTKRKIAAAALGSFVSSVLSHAELESLSAQR